MRTNKGNNSSKCSKEFIFNFANRLRTARNNKSITQEDMAEKLNIACRTYQHYESENESNGRVPNLEQIQAISDILDCDITYLTSKNKDTEFRMKYKNAANELGLDYVTIKEFKSMTTSQKHIIDSLFSRTYSGTLLIETIQQMIYYSNPSVNNSVYITLDKYLTSKDVDYESLQNKLNDNQIKNMLSYHLSIVMNDILNSLVNDEALLDEIKNDYEKKYFSNQKSIKALSIDDLPKFNDKTGKLEYNIIIQIEKLENKILDRYEHREKNNNYFNYADTCPKTRKDFCEIIRTKRRTVNSNLYYEWLKQIEELTR